MSNTLATTFALSAAALFLGACEKTGADTATPGMDQTTKVKCMGINECKAQGACDVPDGHSCAGQNECKGKGWIMVSKADCDDQGGQIL